MDTGDMLTKAPTKAFIADDSVLLSGRCVPGGIPDWLAAMAEAAGMTAFTDEFDRAGKEWNPFNEQVAPIEKLIGR